MPNELQQNRYDQLIRRVGGIIGPGSKVSEALGELFPVIDIERVPGELLALGGTFLCVGSLEAPSGVAEFATVQLFNPVGSGKLITISSVLAAPGLQSGFRWALVTVALPTTVAGQRFRDGRFVGTERPAGQIRSDVTAAATTRDGQSFNPSNDPMFLNDVNGVAILPPGIGFNIQQTSANVNMRVTFFWRERVALEAELQF